MAEIVVAPPAIYMQQVIAAVGPHVAVAGQNAHEKGSGAYTGEISAEMLKDLGAKWVILGHSERREIYKEPNQLIANKVKHALEVQLGVIFCCGETLQQREANETLPVVFKQLDALKQAGITDWSKIVIAYEPVWAIGTGKVATPEQAQEVHCEIRTWVKQNLDENQAQTIRIIYGGSVNGKNCQELARKDDIDGFLVGGASLKPEFGNICSVVI